LIGNKLDIFWLAGQRGDDYTESDYVAEWNGMYTAIRSAMRCFDRFFAPCFAGVVNQSIWRLDPLVTWEKLQARVKDGSIAEFS
jgi:hypothetical protein